MTQASDPSCNADARRRALLSLGWPTSKDVASRAQQGSGEWTRAKREVGEVLGVWDEAINTYRHPDFQFQVDGGLRPEVKELLAVLAQNPAWSTENDPTGWRRAYWFYQPFRSLSAQVMSFAAEQASFGPEGSPLKSSPEEALSYLQRWMVNAPADAARARTPAEVFVENAPAVIAWARKEVGLTEGQAVSA